MEGGPYILSSKYKAIMCYLISGSTIHGPCSGGSEYVSELNYDTAHCFVSDNWSFSASSWIDKFISNPSQHVGNDIARNRYRFVSIRLKKNFDYE